MESWNKSIRLSLSITVLVLSVSTFARTLKCDFIVDSLCYEILSEEEHTVGVSYDFHGDYIPELKNKRPTGELIIPDTVVFNGTKYTVTEISNYGFEDLFSIPSVKLPNTLKKINDGGLCQALSSEELYLPPSVEYLGFAALVNNNLKTVNLENVKYFGSYALMKTSVTEAYIRRNVQYDAGVFFKCNELEKVIIEDGVTSLPSYIFGNCPNLRKVELPNSLTDIGDHALDGCTIDSITIPKEVKILRHGLLAENHNLKEVILPEGIDTIEYWVFLNCYSLEKIHIPASVRYIHERAVYFFKEPDDPTPQIKDIYCEGTTPPKEGCYVEGGTLHVPKGYKEIYATTDNWAKYGENIVDDIELSGIHNAQLKTQDFDTPKYDLQGRRVAHPKQGEIYIQGGRKVMR